MRRALSPGHPTYAFCLRLSGDQRGVALLTVLLVTALVTVLAVAMVSRQQIDIRRTANIIEADRAYWLAKGGETWAVKLLTRDLQKGATDHLEEEWARGLTPVAVGEGMVAGSIVDLQGRFNLNNLMAIDQGVREGSRQQFARLLVVCGLPPEVLPAVIDWEDDDGDKGWAEDWAYAHLLPPYRTANQALTSISELRLVQGMSNSGYACLEPLVAALPVETYLNVNTASAKLLATLAEGVTLAQAEALVAARPRDGYEKLADFLAAPEWAGSGLSGDHLTLASNFFLLQCRTSVERGRSTIFTLIQREKKGVRVVRRSLGVE